MAAVYLLVPLIDAMVTRIKSKILIPVCIALIAMFAGDLIYSHFVPNVGEGITDYTPAAFASSAISSQLKEVRMMIGVSCPTMARMWRVVSMPSISGMRQSIRIRL